MEHSKFTELRAFFQFHLEFIDVAIQFSFLPLLNKIFLLPILTALNKCLTTATTITIILIETFFSKFICIYYTCMNHQNSNFLTKECVKRWEYIICLNVCHVLYKTFL